MKLSFEQQRRLEALAAEMAEVFFGGDRRDDGTPKTFEELEDECVGLGDLLTCGVLQRRVAAKEAAADTACCPDCARPGGRLPDDEVRLLQTSRGEVATREPVYYCRRCRRSFFPSVG